MRYVKYLFRNICNRMRVGINNSSITGYNTCNLTQTKLLYRRLTTVLVLEELVTVELEPIKE